jgi:peroxiredoxin
MVKIGDKSPDVVLKDQAGNVIKVADLKGKKVLLSFHPLAWTRVCAEQMKALEANHQAFADLNTVALGLSVDSVPCKKAWARELGISKTSLLADFWPHGQVAKAFGIFRENDGYSERANVLLNENQEVIWVKVYPIPQLPDVNEIIQTIKGTGAG